MAGSDGEHKESSSESSGGDSDGADIEALRVTQEMGRAVLDLQIENINGLNEKAAQTIRFNVLILGVVLTIFSLIFKNGGEAVQARSMLNGATGGAILLSGVSILAALWTYTSSRKEVGATGPAMEQVLDDDTSYTQRQWLTGVIRSQSNWIAENEQVNREDALYLFVSHLYLFVSIGLYAFGVAWGLEWWSLHEGYYWGSILLLAVCLPSLVLLPSQYQGQLPDRVEEAINTATDALMDEK